MIIDTSYFLTKSVYIPNAVAQPSIGGNTPDAVIQLQQEIGEKEAKVLISALGFEQYSELADQFETDGSYKPAALQKWKDLVDGVTFDDKRWNGLRYEFGTKKISLIAFYVYFYYLGSDFTSYTTVGVQQPNAENSINQTPNQKQANAWNEFVRMYNGSDVYGRNYSFFRNWNGEGMQWNGSSRDTNDVSLYEYMSAHTDLYDLSFFKRETIINPFNL